eukprot:m.605606 g.605606  ORF g.605606 m.605606 type:complete len:717 (+) comp22466_c0_seq1:74-2224(+)
MATAASKCVILGALVACGAQAARRGDDSRPNVLFMMADQLRHDVNGYTGNRAAITPGLDRLAAEGMAVKYSYSSTPTCTPARAGLLTGKSPWNHGMLGYGTVAPRYAVEMPRILADAGYTTASFGKDHFGWNATSNKGIAHGYENTMLYDGLGSWKEKAVHHWSGEYDEYNQWFATQMPDKDPEATLDEQGAARGGANDGWNGWHGAAYIYDEFYHPTAWVGRLAVNFIKDYLSNHTNPFFLKVSFHRPHSPYDPPKRVLDKFDAATLPPIVTGDTWDLRFRGSKGDPPGCGPSPDAWCGLMPVNESDVSRCAYYASVSFVDEQIVQIYNALNTTGLLDNTYIIFSADHGDGQGEHYHWRKGFPYEFSSHVPMLVRWPDSEVTKRSITLARGTMITDLVTELRDVLHTVVDAAQATASVPAGSFQAEDGKSMLCLLQDPTGQKCSYALNPGPWRQVLDLEHSTCYNETNHWNALTDGRMKYVFRAFFADEQLFNLTADPYEVHELSQDAAYATELKTWRQRMVSQFQHEGRGSDWVSSSGVLMQRLSGQTYSPHYPHGPPAVAGDKIALDVNSGGDDQWFINATANGTSLFRLQVNPTLCLALTNGSTLIVDVCDATESAQQFALMPQPTDISGEGQYQYNWVRHVPTQQCVTVQDANTAVMTPCASPVSKPQLWVDGTSGRLCADEVNSKCICALGSWREWTRVHHDPSTDLQKY